MDAARWDERYAAKESVFSEVPTPVLVELVSSLHPGRALDLGAGEGRHAVWLARRGWRVTAVDFSRVALDKLARRAEAESLDVRPVVADVRDYRPEPAGFELVLIAYLHPEPLERARIFSRAARAVASGGHLLAVGRDLADLHRDGDRGPPDPERRFTPQRLAGAFPGIELDRYESVTREVATEERPPRLVDTLAWRTRPGGA